MESLRHFVSAGFKPTLPETALKGGLGYRSQTHSVLAKLRHVQPNSALHGGVVGDDAGCGKLHGTYSIYGRFHIIVDGCNEVLHHEVFGRTVPAVVSFRRRIGINRRTSNLLCSGLLGHGVYIKVASG